MKPEQFVKLAKHLIRIIHQTKDDQPVSSLPSLILLMLAGHIFA